jgi:N-acetyl-anhydromuramyl-L-alanine amidase AmpD
MNLFEYLFYSKYVATALYPIPVIHWQIWNEALATFPVIEFFPGYLSSSRRTKKPQIIILHHTGSLDSNKALRWFGNPNNYASTHWLVDLDGHIRQLVQEENSSLHIQNAVYKHSRLVAEMSFGIHLVGNGYDRFTEAQYEAAAMLCVYLEKKYGLKNEDIYRHAEVEVTNSVAPATDPAPWDKEKFQTLLDKFTEI